MCDLFLLSARQMARISPQSREDLPPPSTAGRARKSWHPARHGAGAGLSRTCRSALQVRLILSMPTSG